MNVERKMNVKCMSPAARPAADHKILKQEIKIQGGYLCVISKRL